MDSYHLIDLISQLTDLMDQMHDPRDRQVLLAKIKALLLQFKLHSLQSSVKSPKSPEVKAPVKKIKEKVQQSSSKQRLILNAFENDNQLRLNDVVKFAKVSKRTALRHLRDLIDNGVIKRKVEGGVVFFIRSAITSSS